MNPLKMMLAVVAVMAASLTVQAQTADDIINKHLDAVGGKDKLNQIKSMVIEATVNAMGADNPSTTTLIPGIGYKSEMEMNGQKTIQTITDKSGWMINPFQGSSNVQPMPEEQYKGSLAQLYVDPFLDYATHGDKVELQGKEGNTYKLLLTSKDNIVTTYFIDASSYFVTKAVRSISMGGNEAELTVSFSNQKPTDFGNVMPYTTEIAYGSMFSMTSTVKKVVINGSVDPKVFDMPK
jgi:hypothetical protein